MPAIIDAPSELGSYMLKGWVLTDRPCPTSGCRIPLLRSPAGQDPVVHLCVSCNADSDAPRQPPATPASSAPQAETSTSTSTSSYLTRTSTPATEISEDTDDLPPFVETEETRRRRDQTDRASAEIGRRLLQGWTMLGDECPRDACYYVPLVRPPKSGRETDPKKECVLCGSIYTTEKDWAGRESLVLVNTGPSSQTAAPASDTPAPINAPLAFPANQSPKRTDVLPSKHSAPIQLEQSTTAALTTPLARTLNASSEALNLSLQALTTRLTSLASNPTLTDPDSIATTADAITKVTQALSQVKQLQWSEVQAHSLT